MGGATIDDAGVAEFVKNGSLRVEEAFSRELAAECRKIMWRDIDGEPDDPASWTNPVVRLGAYAQEPFRAAAGSPRLHAAFDALVGEGRWAPLGALGTSRCGSAVTRSRVATDGTSMRAFPETIPPTSWRTARTSPPADGGY